MTHWSIECDVTSLSITNIVIIFMILISLHLYVYQIHNEVITLTNSNP